MDKVNQEINYIEKHQQPMIDLWKQMVNIDCGSQNKEGVKRVADVIQPLLEDMDFTVKRYPQDKNGDVLIANDCIANRPVILLMGHMDTVFKEGEVARRPFQIQDGKAYGPGVLDMKGGITILLYVLKALKNSGFDKYSFKVLLAPDEEVGHVDSKTADIFANEAKGAAAAFNFETGFLDRSIVTRRKGVCSFYLETFGVSCHVGNDPENGRSAIREICRKVEDIERLTDFKRNFNLNVGVIQGGTVPNAGPAYARIDCNFRYPSMEIYKEVMGKVKQIAQKQYIQGTSTKLTVLPSNGPMIRLSGVDQLMEAAIKASAALHIPIPKERYCGGGSDSTISTMEGVPTLCAMGVLGARNHTKEEFAEVDTLFERAKLMILIINNLKFE